MANGTLQQSILVWDGGYDPTANTFARKAAIQQTISGQGPGWSEAYKALILSGHGRPGRSKIVISDSTIPPENVAMELSFKRPDDQNWAFIFFFAANDPDLADGHLDAVTKGIEFRMSTATANTTTLEVTAARANTFAVAGSASWHNPDGTPLTTTGRTLSSDGLVQVKRHATNALSVDLVHATSGPQAVTWLNPGLDPSNHAAATLFTWRMSLAPNRMDMYWGDTHLGFVTYTEAHYSFAKQTSGDNVGEYATPQFVGDKYGVLPLADNSVGNTFLIYKFSLHLRQDVFELAPGAVHRAMLAEGLALPEISSADNGKHLAVAGGVWATSVRPARHFVRNNTFPAPADSVVGDTILFTGAAAAATWYQADGLTARQGILPGDLALYKAVDISGTVYNRWTYQLGLVGEQPAEGGAGGAQDPPITNAHLLAILGGTAGAGKFLGYEEGGTNPAWKDLPTAHQTVGAGVGIGTMIYNRLKGAPSALNSLVGDKIYPQIAPQCAEMPMVIYVLLDTEYEHALNVDQDLEGPIIQVDAYAETFLEAEAVADGVAARLRRWTDSTAKIEDTLIRRRRSILDEPTRTHRIIQEFQVFHR